MCTQVKGKLCTCVFEFIELTVVRERYARVRNGDRELGHTFYESKFGGIKNPHEQGTTGGSIRDTSLEGTS